MWKTVGLRVECRDGRSLVSLGSDTMQLKAQVPAESGARRKILVLLPVLWTQLLVDNARITLVGSWGTNEMRSGHNTGPNTLAAVPRCQHPPCDG